MDTGVLGGGGDPIYCGHRIAAPDRFLLCRGTEYDAGRSRGAEHLLQEGAVAGSAQVTSPLLEMTAMQRDTCRPLLADIDMSTSRPVVVTGDRLWTTSGSDARLCNVSASGIIQSSKFTNNVISGRKVPLGTSGCL